jgi:hypothetical protein
MTMSVKIEGELRYADAATAAAAHAAMMQGRAGNPILEDGARLDGAAIRFAFDDFISYSGASDRVDSAEFGVEKALETAVSGEVVARYEGEPAWKKSALDHPFWQRKWDKAETGFHEPARRPTSGGSPRAATRSRASSSSSTRSPSSSPSRTSTSGSTRATSGSTRHSAPRA